MKVDLDTLAKEQVLKDNGLNPETIEAFEDLNFVLRGALRVEVERFKEGFLMACFRMGERVEE
jgi:hypothetical protein